MNHTPNRKLGKPYTPKSPSDIPFLITLAVASFLAGVGLTIAVVMSWWAA